MARSAVAEAAPVARERILAAAQRRFAAFGYRRTGIAERAREALAGPGTAVERLGRLAQASVAFNRENSLINSVFRRDDEIIFAPLVDELHEQLVTKNVAM